MKYCANCGTKCSDDAAFCPNCGSSVASIAPATAAAPQANPVPEANVPQAPTAAPQPAAEPKKGGTIDYSDHTAEFDTEEIKDNRLYALTCYMFGFIGMIIALLAAKDSSYVKFHVRECLKLEIAETLAVLIACVLCWTFIVGIAGVAAVGVLCVIRIIAFIWTIQGKAKEVPILKYFKFLK